MNEITVQELKEKIDNDEKVFILDVREPFEKFQSDIEYEQKLLIPLGDLSGRMSELDDFKEKEIVCLCRSGNRSGKACTLLEKEGFGNVKNLKGGINQWARDIDPGLPVY